MATLRAIIVLCMCIAAMARSQRSPWLYAAHGVTRVPYAPMVATNLSAMVNISTSTVGLYVRQYITEKGVLAFAAVDGNGRTTVATVNLTSGRVLGKTMMYSNVQSCIHGYGDGFLLGAQMTGYNAIAVFAPNASAILTLNLQGQPQLVGAANTNPVLFSAADTSGNYAVTAQGKVIACYNQTSGLTWSADGREFYNDHGGSVTRFNATLTDDCEPTAVFQSPTSVLTSNQIVSDTKRNVFTAEYDGQGIVYVKKYWSNGTTAWNYSTNRVYNSQVLPLISLSDDEMWVLYCRTKMCVRLDAQTGAVRWTFNETVLRDTIDVRSQYYTQRMPFITHEGNVVVISKTNQTAVLVNGTTGRIVRSVPTQANKLSTPMFTMDESGYLYLIAGSQGSVFIKQYKIAF